jgi:hypothetical protein
VITTGVHHNDPALEKPKIICMSQAFDDIITNERRFTFDKRGDGTIGWRFITHLQEVDTGPDQRKVYAFNFQLTYFWRFTWRGGFATATVMEGPAGGNGQDHVVYQVTNPYKGAYDPIPHIAFAGCPIGRSGAGSASIPGVIMRQLWLSPNPRPASINQ